MTCRHPRAIGVDTGDYLTPARLLVPVGMYPDLDRWCPDCGSVRVKQHEGARPTWIRPGEDAGVLVKARTNA